MDINIRDYDAGDVPELRRIWNSIIEKGMAFPRESVLSEKEAMMYFLGQSKTRVAEVDGKVVGGYVLHPNGSGRRGHVCNASYGVDPAMAGKGIGSELMDDSMSVARELGFRLMQFNAVVQDNASAIHLYEKKGFVRIGAVPGGFRSADGEYRTVVLFYHEL